jgi:uncharacterized membrane protein YcaP (DUF421 family)
MEIIVRATVIYFFLWGVSRAMGKRTLSELTAFELILLVTMGDLVQQGVTQEDMSLTGAMLAVGTFAMWILGFSVLAWRFRSARNLIEGVAVVVMRDGEIIEEALRIERVTKDEVCEEARLQGIADLDTVRLAILEPDGKFSFIRDDASQQRGGDQDHRA